MSRQVLNTNEQPPQGFFDILEESSDGSFDSSDGSFDSSDDEADINPDEVFAETSTFFRGNNEDVEMLEITIDTAGASVEGFGDRMAGDVTGSCMDDFQFQVPVGVSRGRGQTSRGGRRGCRNGRAPRDILAHGTGSGAGAAQRRQRVRHVGEGGTRVSGDLPIEVYSLDDQVPPELSAFSQAKINRMARGGHIRQARGARLPARSDYPSTDGTYGDVDENPSETSAHLLTDDEDASGFSWTGISSFTGQRETFAPERAGPTADYEAAYDAFRAIWTDDILDIIVVETNRYAVDARRRDRLSLTWKDTNRDEILILFVFFMMLGIIRMPTIRSCFSPHWLLRTNVFKKLLSHKRLLELTKCLHFGDNDRTYTSPENKELSKISPIINHLNAKFQELYVPSQNITIGESLTSWRGKLDMKQFMKTKAGKFGIKTFELCDSTSSYLWSFFVYAGRDTSYDGSITQGVLKSTSTVLRLITPLLNKGYTLWMNNWFNSPLLARYLKRNKTDCAGTLCPNRADVPPAFSRINMADGHFFGRHAGDVAVLSWQDEKKVTTISTYHGAEMEAGPSRGSKEIYKPKVIRDYNKYMGGVDQKDQMLEPYLIERKRCHKWYLKLFKRLLNVSIHNSFVMFRQSSQTSKITNMNFRLSLADQLTNRHLMSEQVFVPRQHTIDSFSNPTRLFPSNNFHFPITNSTTDSQTDETDGELSRPVRKRRMRCVWCSNRNGVEKRSNYICKHCKVPLCIEPCFEYYHSRE